MKIVTVPTNGEILDKKDPYPYGWREAIRTLPNGTEVLERTPLTLEDILHPQVGDYRMHDEEHERFCNYLYNEFTNLRMNCGGVHREVCRIKFVVV